MPKEYDLALEVTIEAGNRYTGTYTLRLGDCTGLDDLAAIGATGHPILELMALQERNGGYLAIMAATVVWLSVRKERPHTSYEEVLAAMPWGGDWEMTNPNVVPEGKGEGSEDEPLITE